MMDFPETTKRFIAYFDIMGFKDRVYRDGHEAVSGIMDIVSGFIAKLKEEGPAYFEKLGVVKKNSSRVGIILPVLFSDTILFVSQNNSYFDALNTILHASIFMFTMFKEQIPLKGALAYGKFTANSNRSKFFGRPLVDAYLLAEETYFYGVILHHSFEKFLSESKKPYPAYLLSKNLVPMKGGAVTQTFVDWRLGLSKPNDPWEPLFEKFYLTVSGNTRKYVDNSLDLYRNSRAFFTLKS